MRLMRTQPVLILLVLVSLPLAALAQSNSYNGSTYFVLPDPAITWSDAEGDAPVVCPENDGYLATITSPGEDAFIESLRMAYVNENGGKSEFWVGGFQDPPDEMTATANWFWLNDEGPIPGTNGDPSGYANWLDLEPNDNYGAGTEQHMAIGLKDDIAGWNDEGITPNTGLGNIGGYIVECPFVAPGEDVVVIAPAEDQPVTAVVQEVVLEGTIEPFTCVIKEPKYRRHWQKLDLIRRIKRTNTVACNELEAQLEPWYEAKLRSYQRAFTNSSSPDHNKKDIVVTLIKSRDLFGMPADLTQGVVIFESDAAAAGVDEPDCRVDRARISPTTVRINLSGEEPSGDLGTNATTFCNRTRDAGRFSDQLIAYPLRSVAFGPAQVAVEASTFRRAVRFERRAGCVNPVFLNRLLDDFNEAMAYVQFGSAAQKLEGIEMLQDATVLALDPAEYGTCPDALGAQGQFVARLLAITFQSHRYILFPNTDDVPYVIPDGIKILLPPFPGDPPVVLPVP